MGFPGGLVVKNPLVMQETACNAEEAGSIPGSGRSPGEGNSNPLQYSCLSSLAWTEKPSGLQSMASQESDTT